VCAVAHIVFASGRSVGLAGCFAACRLHATFAQKHLRIWQTQCGQTTFVLSLVSAQSLIKDLAAFLKIKRAPDGVTLANPFFFSLSFSLMIGTEKKLIWIVVRKEAKAK
jgi:hypothetical protein